MSAYAHASQSAELKDKIKSIRFAMFTTAEPEEHTYVSVSGQAERVVDREKIKAMWNAGVQAWYPNGPNDPHVVLIRVVSHTAEYWDSSSSGMVQLFNMAKAVLTGTTPDDGEHGRLKL